MEPTPEEEYEDPGLFSTPGAGGRAHARLLAFQRAFLPSVYLGVFAAGLLGNALVLAVHARYRARRSLTDLLLLNLPVADLAFVCTLPFWAFASSREWVFGQAACKVVQGVYALTLYASMLTLTAITVDRLVVVAQATRAYTQRARRAAWGRAVCALAWAAAGLLALPQVLYGRVERLDGLACHYHHADTSTAVLATQAALGLFVPGLAMLVCYPLLVCALLRARGPRRARSLRLALLAAGLFVLTQAPHAAAQLAQASRWELATSAAFGYALAVTEALAYARACLDPALYAFLGLNFRRNLRRLARDLRRRLPGAGPRARASEDASRTDASRTGSAAHPGEATAASTCPL